ncbi:S1 RNA-binding domain-containing protein [Vibrio crassostreae]|uniref:S1 RNA-binding domain-containing protein n=1 Tax=Vibrio crassostreae TaxID=246167 RepID=UPI001B3035F8|nr:S1 RNA-binding domain-containing protein [Vibrio crassostreae]
MQTFESLLDESIGDLEFKPDTIVEAEVISVDRYRATVDAGLPIEAYIPVNEFEERPQVGEMVKVIIDALDDGEGNVEISHEKAVERETREEVHLAIEEKNIISAKVVEVHNAGLLVRVRNIDGFIPKSLVDTVIIDRATLLGQTVSVIPLSFDPKKKNVVVSRKEALIKERGGVMEKLEEEVQIGDIREGIVKNVLKFGAFVDLGGKDCLIHITDASWNPMAVNPFEFFQIGQRVKGLINKTDHLGRLYMSLRDADRSPWEKAKAELEIGAEVEVTSYKVDDRKNLLVVVNDVMGVVPNADISWSHMKSYELINAYPTGSKVKAVVTGFKEESGQEAVVLSMKSCGTNPWEEAKDILVEGNTASVTVKAVTEHNVFVNVAKDIDAIIPFKEICWKDPYNAIKGLAAGDNVDVKIINVDMDNRKVTASLKEIVENPFSNLKKGTEVEGVVTGFSRNGDAVMLEIDNKGSKLAGIVSSRHATPNKMVKANEYYTVGDKVSGAVINIDSGKVMVNLRKKEAKPQKKINNAMREALEQAQA